MKRKAMSLLEITLACFIICLALIPLITNSRNDAAKAIETEKIQMAERILESIKSELMTMKFESWEKRTDSEGAGPFELSSGFYPSSLNKVLETQKKYKDFEVTGSWNWAEGSNGKPDKTMVQAEISCTFSRSGKDMTPIERKKAFLIVKP